MRIRTADTERTDPGPTRTIRSRPIDHMVEDLERRGREIDLGIWRAVVDARWNLLVVQRQGRLDQAGHAGRGDQMAEIALHRTEPASLGRVGVDAECAGQRLDLDGIAERGAGAMRLDIANRAGVDACTRQREADRAGLATHAWRAKACLFSTVVVDADAADHRPDRVALRDRIGKPFEHDDASAGGEHGTCRVRIKRSAMTVRRLNRTLGRQIARLLRHHNIHAAGKRDIALPAHQRVPGLCDRDQRG